MEEIRLTANQLRYRKTFESWDKLPLDQVVNAGFLNRRPYFHCFLGPMFSYHWVFTGEKATENDKVSPASTETLRERERAMYILSS